MSESSDYLREVGDDLSEGHANKLYAVADELDRKDAEIARLRAALEPFVLNKYVADDAPCHVGIIPKEQCLRCSAIIAGRAALKGEAS